MDLLRLDSRWRCNGLNPKAGLDGRDRPERQPKNRTSHLLDGEIGRLRCNSNSIPVQCTSRHVGPAAGPLKLFARFCLSWSRHAHTSPPREGGGMVAPQGLLLCNTTSLDYSSRRPQLGDGCSSIQSMDQLLPCPALPVAALCMPSLSRQHPARARATISS